jgi:4-hydroxy-3-polyprenylbenzoate decarboxylase
VVSDPAPAARRVVVAITGATGSIYGIRLLETLRREGVETHLVISAWGARTIEHETSYTVGQVRALASNVEPIGNQAAAISSGSFHTDGMVVAPCSMKTLAAIAHGMANDLVGRAADVVLKERRKLVLVARETPLSEIHLENMLRLTRAGAVILPPMPAFYSHPTCVDDVVDHIVGRVLDQFGLDADLVRRWDGHLLAAGRTAGELGATQGPGPGEAAATS